MNRSCYGINKVLELKMVVVVVVVELFINKNLKRNAYLYLQVNSKLSFTSHDTITCI